MVFTFCLKVVAFSLFVASRIQAGLEDQFPIKFSSNSTENCQDACDDLANTLGNGMVYSDKTVLPTLLKEFYTAQQQETVPRCLVRPSTADEVAKIIMIAKRYQCIFAAKSGGHAMFSGASNAEGGITIDLVNLNTLKISEDNLTVSVGTGNRWVNVYDYLDPMNLTAVGGRDSDVGVGGNLLGGGVSLISRRYGWGLDNVRNYELVMANGSISNINYSSNPELYWALRGGGNNFGTVTRFDVETHAQPPMWGGLSVMLFSDLLLHRASSQSPRLPSFYPKAFLHGVGYFVNKVGCMVGYCISFADFSELTEKFAMDAESDPDAQAFSVVLYTSTFNMYFAAFNLNHGSILSNPPGFGKFNSLKKIYSTNRISKQSDLARQIASMNPKGDRVIYEAATFKINTVFMKEVIKIYMSEVEAIQHVKGFWGAIPTQLISKDEISKFSKNGGNALGITEEDGPLLLFSTAFTWSNKADDEAVIQASKNIIDRAVALSKEMGLHHRYIYQNYAAQHQDVFAGYGEENRKRLKEIQKKYDPEGVFSKLQPGYFKV